MKRFLALLLCIALFLGLVPTAMADAALPQDVATYFSDAKFNGYTFDQCVEVNNYCFVLLRNEKENILYGFRKSNGAYKYWMRSKNAVPQSASGLEMFNCKDYVVEGSMLKLGNSSFGIMAMDANGSDFEAVYYSLVDDNWLVKAYVNTAVDISMYFKYDTLTYYSYYDRDRLGTMTGTFQRDIRHTNVNRIPRSLADAKAKLTTAPELPADSELVAEEIKFTGGKKYSVYSGPGKDFLRGGNNKAAVSTNDWIQVFGEEDGWILVQYAINKNTYRFGYIEATALPKNTTVKALDFNATEATATVAVNMTDDPLFSNTTLTSLPAGTQVTWLATMGNWAYIATELNNTPVRGFVPASALELVPIAINED